MTTEYRIYDPTARTWWARGNTWTADRARAHAFSSYTSAMQVWDSLEVPNLNMEITAIGPAGAPLYRAKVER